MNKTVGSSMKLCGTCNYWCGKQEPDTFRKFVTFDDHEKARCSAVPGKTILGHSAGCYKWEKRFR